jgi:hypothetical protein
MSNFGFTQGKNNKYLPVGTTSYNINCDDDFIYVDTSIGPVSLYLPNIKGNGLDYEPKKFYISDNSGNAGTNNITIYGVGGNLINSGASITLNSNGANAECVIAGTNEWLVNRDSAYAGAVWGSITGTLSNQTDLQAALDAKQNLLLYYKESSSGPNTAPVNSGTFSVVIGDAVSNGVGCVGNYLFGNSMPVVTSSSIAALSLNTTISGSTETLSVSISSTIATAVNSGFFGRGITANTVTGSYAFGSTIAMNSGASTAFAFGNSLTFNHANNMLIGYGLTSAAANEIIIGHNNNYYIRSKTAYTEIAAPYGFNDTANAVIFSSTSGNFLTVQKCGSFELNNFNNNLGADTPIQNFSGYFKDYLLSSPRNALYSSGNTYFHITNNLTFNSAPYMRAGLNTTNTDPYTLLKMELDRDGAVTGASPTILHLVDAYGSYDSNDVGDWVKTGHKIILQDAFINSGAGINTSRGIYLSVSGGDVNQAIYIAAGSVHMAATGGTGFMEYVAQSSNASAPSAAGMRLFAGSTGELSWARKNGSDVYVRVLDGTLTANRTYTLQDASMTIAGTAPTQGGTGQTSVTTGDLLYGSATNTWSKLAAVATGSYLRSAGIGTAPVWSTLVLPNSATADRIVYATSSNTWGDSANLTFNGTTFGVTGKIGITNSTGGNNSGTTGNSNYFTITGATANDTNYPGILFVGGTSVSSSTYPYISLGNGGLSLQAYSGLSSTTKMFWAIDASYGFYIAKSVGGTITYPFIQNVAGNLYLAPANTVVNPTISAALHIVKTTEQLRVGYDASNYFSATVGSSGGVTLDAVGSGAGFTFNDDVILIAGKFLNIKSGSNQRAGNATLVSGTVTVSNTTVTANTIVVLTRKTSSGTIGTAITYTVSAGTSFTITSDNVLDTSTFSYLLIEVN